ncbi:hypothetical protein O181_066217 [Austropuccinia psidii MF-1]|uniref:Mitochondrial import inner membrane translocase subunit TIM16 n=1 Tax=Austropuccinia psidii MF-1 TaxID=1389203 RepID=A0A9Q3EYR5_9BASI|nr:hypothetical protein [Austropuccinia psidii MF-1]
MIPGQLPVARLAAVAALPGPQCIRFTDNLVYRLGMSLPRIVSQVVILGSQILGKAFVEAYRQAARNARSGASQSGGGASGSGGTATGNYAGDGSVITRKHRMTVDEACQILNVNNVQFSSGPNNPTVSEELTNMLKAYERLYNANQDTSKYLLSKVVRAKDRISAEVELAQDLFKLQAEQSESLSQKKN